MNKALLAKLGWRLLHNRESLWAQVLRSKYKVKEIQDPSWLVVNGRWSSTWRSISIGLREVIAPGVSWVVGDGQSVRFWRDKWLSNISLLDVATRDIHARDLNLKVCDLWRNNGGWLLDQIEPLLPHNYSLQLRSVVLDNVTGARDRLSWRESEDGSFTVKLAYSFLTRDETPRQNLTTLFQRVWKVIVPERVRVFIWLGVHQVLMTNMERQRRHLCVSGICQVCKGGEESILHILRDCPAIAGIWIRLLPQSKRIEFFAKSLIEWLYENLGDHKRVGDTIWSTLFAMTIWWGWKWRCGNVFGVNGKCRDRVKFVKEIAKEVSIAHNQATEPSLNQRTRVERMIAWKRPCGDWLKLNTDGASRGNPGLATAGGVIRDAGGLWCVGFALNIGICSTPLAELWGVYYGLVIAWERQVMRLEIEVDSELVVGFLRTGINDSNPLSFLVRLCHGLISKDWIVRISHVYREANRLADGLANYAFSLPLGFHLFHASPDIVSPLLLEDVEGVSFPRQVVL